MPPTWDDMRQKKLDAEQRYAGEPKPLRAMHLAHGTTPGKTCGDCKFILGVRQSTTWYKCQKYRLSRSASSDFRLKWEACGLWEQGPDGIEILITG